MSAFDAAWMMKRFSTNVDPLELLKEREAIYLLLPNITIQKNHATYTIDPTTRYPASALKGLAPRVDVAKLYDNGTDPVHGVKKEQDASVKEPTPTHVVSSTAPSQDSGSLSTKPHSAVVLDYEAVPSNDPSHYPQ